MKQKEVPEVVVGRLPKYYRHLRLLQKQGVTKISSLQLASGLGVNPSQIRQDLSYFGEFGRKGYGYVVQDLLWNMRQILHVDRSHSLIVVGVGNLGHALIQNFAFEEAGCVVLAAFDIRPNLIGTAVNGVPVYGMEELPAWVERYRPEIALLSVSRKAAQSVCTQLEELGIQGIWNLTNVDLESTRAQVQNVHLLDSLQTLTFYLKAPGEKIGKNSQSKGEGPVENL